MLYYTGVVWFRDILRHTEFFRGAVVMNAGASGEEIKDILVKVRYFSLDDMSVKEIFKEEIDFEYRNSFFQRNTNNIILSATLSLTPGSKEDIKENGNN